MTADSPSCLRLTLDDGVATITLQRPHARNALNDRLKSELGVALAAVSLDTAVGAVVLAGEGSSFCAGGDTFEMRSDRTPEERRTRHLAVVETIARPLLTMSKPTIAAVRGHAFGAGLSLAAGCDIVVAADDATFSTSFARVALIPDLACLYTLPRRIGAARTKRLYFTSETVGALDAERMGLVDLVVDPARVLDEAWSLAARCAAGPRTALALGKQLIDRSLDSSLEQMLTAEVEAQMSSYATADHGEGVAALRKGRPPQFNQRERR